MKSIKKLQNGHVAILNVTGEIETALPGGLLICKHPREEGHIVISNSMSPSDAAREGYVLRTADVKDLEDVDGNVTAFTGTADELMTILVTDFFSSASSGDRNTGGLENLTQLNYKIGSTTSTGHVSDIVVINPEVEGDYSVLFWVDGFESGTANSKGGATSGAANYFNNTGGNLATPEKPYTLNNDVTLEEDKNHFFSCSFGSSVYEKATFYVGNRDVIEAKLDELLRGQNVSSGVSEDAGNVLKLGTDEKPFFTPFDDILVMRQDLNDGGLFADNAEALSSNSDAAIPLNESKYSIMNVIENLKAADGVYYFTAVWSDMVTGSESEIEIKWKQTSNPLDVTAETVQGFELISSNIAVNDFRGLALSSAPQTLFDGENGSNWWFAMGIIDAFTGNTFPVVQSPQHTARKFELYVNNSITPVVVKNVTEGAKSLVPVGKTDVAVDVGGADTAFPTGWDLTDSPEDLWIRFIPSDSGGPRDWASGFLNVDRIIDRFNAGDGVDGYVHVFDNDYLVINLVDASTGEFVIRESGRNVVVRAELYRWVEVLPAIMPIENTSLLTTTGNWQNFGDVNNLFKGEDGAKIHLEYGDEIRDSFIFLDGVARAERKGYNDREIEVQIIAGQVQIRDLGGESEIEKGWYSPPQRVYATGGGLNITNPDEANTSYSLKPNGDGTYSFKPDLTGIDQATLDSAIATLQSDNATQTELDAAVSSINGQINTINSDNATQTELDAAIATINSDNATDTELAAAVATLNSAIGDRVPESVYDAMIAGNATDAELALVQAMILQMGDEPLSIAKLDADGEIMAMPMSKMPECYKVSVVGSNITTSNPPNWLVAQQWDASNNDLEANPSVNLPANTALVFKNWMGTNGIDAVIIFNQPLQLTFDAGGGITFNAVAGTNYNFRFSLNSGFKHDSGSSFLFTTPLGSAEFENFIINASNSANIFTDIKPTRAGLRIDDFIDWFEFNFDCTVSGQIQLNHLSNGWTFEHVAPSVFEERIVSLYTDGNTEYYRAVLSSDHTDVISGAMPLPASFVKKESYQERFITIGVRFSATTASRWNSRSVAYSAETISATTSAGAGAVPNVNDDVMGWEVKAGDILSGLRVKADTNNAQVQTFRYALVFRAFSDGSETLIYDSGDLAITTLKTGFGLNVDEEALNFMAPEDGEILDVGRPEGTAITATRYVQLGGTLKVQSKVLIT